MKCHWYTEENFFSKKEIKEINTLVNKHHNPNYKDIPADTVKKCTVKITDSVYLKQYVKNYTIKLKKLILFILDLMFMIIKITIGYIIIHILLKSGTV
jgi:hypothetical protein